MKIIDKYKRLDYYDKRVAELGGLAILIILLWILTLKGLVNPILAIVLLVSVMIYMKLSMKWEQKDEEKRLR